MTKKLLVVVVALSMICAGKAWTEEAAKAKAKAAPAKHPKVAETRVNESDVGRMEAAVHKAVRDAAVSKQSSGNWEYTAKRMKPPKNDKWVEKWNELGAEGWEAVDHFENIYIFKRPAFASAMRVKSSAPVSTVKEDKEAVQKAKDEEKAAKEKEKADKKAEKKKAKTEKKAEKEKAKEAKKEKKAAEKKAK